MVDGRVGDHALEVALAQGGKGAEHHASESKTHQGECRRVHLSREQGPQDSQEPINSHLRHDARQEHRHASRCFRVCGRQPRMKRKERNLHRKPQEYAEKHRLWPESSQGRQPGAERPAGRQARQLCKVEAPGGHEERREAEEEKYAPAERVDDELVGCVGGSASAPYLDQKEGRDETQFPEQEPVKEVERQEDSKRAALKDEIENSKQPRFVRLSPGSEKPGRSHDSRQQDEDQAQAVDTEKVMGIEGGNPDVPFDELEAGRRGIERGENGEAEQKRGKTRQDRYGATARIRRPGQYRKQQRTDR